MILHRIECFVRTFYESGLYCAALHCEGSQASADSVDIWDIIMKEPLTEVGNEFIPIQQFCESWTVSWSKEREVIAMNSNGECVVLPMGEKFSFIRVENGNGDDWRYRNQKETYYDEYASGWAGYIIDGTPYKDQLSKDFVSVQVDSTNASFPGYALIGFLSKDQMDYAHPYIFKTSGSAMCLSDMIDHAKEEITTIIAESTKEKMQQQDSKLPYFHIHIGDYEYAVVDIYPVSNSNGYLNLPITLRNLIQYALISTLYDIRNMHAMALELHPTTKDGDIRYILVPGLHVLIDVTRVSFFGNRHYTTMKHHEGKVFLLPTEIGGKITELEIY